MPRELPREVLIQNSHIPPSPTLLVLHYIEPSTHDHHQYHATRHIISTMQLDIKFTLKFMTFFAK